ncbi:hypothetical protein Salat_0689300 [Sesamum alatum]|uniref:DUF4378 domain-containing protein n=1 Tax=Sesamum alatum TaxID=300844 RepID=A0AAE2CUS3_9LAMI|nr:hypothetical protein Salat_0689300 [Sesamum alatum]
MDSRLAVRSRALPKPLLLKDYLWDDMSSCSSNGFKSFPRRQCCTNVPFLNEFDRKNKHYRHQRQKKYFNFNQTPPKSALSAFQSVVIAAVKRLPFAANPKKTSFWKRKSGAKEIARWKSFDQLLKEDPEPSDRYYSSVTTRESKSNSSSGSDFTASEECNSSEVNLNLPEAGNDVVEEPKKVASGNREGVNDDVTSESTTSTDGCASTNSSTNTKKQWSSEEKEQFSPVSVLDCPFDDEDEVSSPFQQRLARMEGTKKKLMKKIQRFECLAKLEPTNLSKRFAPLQDSDNESSGSPVSHSSAPINDKFTSYIEEEQDEDVENRAERKALELLHQMQATLQSYTLKLKTNRLLLDFFKERTTNENSEKRSLVDKELLQEAEDWINGAEPRGLFVAWEVEKNRQVYLKDMEKGGEWKTLDQENKELALELESEVFAALLHELLLDISPPA